MTGSKAESAEASLILLEASPEQGYGLLYAIRTARAWWYSAWLRTLARFSRTYIGSFWLGLSNLLSVALLGAVYGAVFNVPDPYNYAIYLGLGLTIWGLISQALISGCGMFTAPTRRDQLVNNALPALFYCLDEWAFQLQTFAQAFLIIWIAAAFLQPTVLVHALTSAWLPLLNLCIFSLWSIMLMAILGARFKDIAQLMPILLQLLFLISPILYKREGLGKVGFLAAYNPLFQILEPLRNAVMHGRVSIGSQLLVLMLNLGLLALLAIALKRLRYRLPLWI